MNMTTNTVPDGMSGLEQSSASGESPASTPSSSSALSGDMQMGRQEFLKLLMTQMKNQDPMNPMKGQEFAAQLAQFSSVEQLMNINESLTSQQSQSQQLAESLKNSTAAGLIGKSVRAAGDSLQLKGQDTADIPFTLERRAKKVRVTISDAAGNPVRTMDFDDMNSGDQSISWDTRNDDGNPVPEGTYTISVSAADSSGESVNARTYLQGTVDRVRFGENDINLVVNGRTVPLSELESVAP